MNLNQATQLMTAMYNHHIGTGVTVSEKRFKALFGVSPLVSGLVLNILIQKSILV